MSSARKPGGDLAPVVGALQLRIDDLHEADRPTGKFGDQLLGMGIVVGDLGCPVGIVVLAQHRCFRVLGARAILLDPLASNTSAIRFYTRLGYRQIDRRVFAGVDDCWVMQLDRSDWERSSPQL